MKLKAAIVQFLEHGEVDRNHSELTLRAYDRFLKRFLSFAGNIEVQAIALPLIQKYRLYLARFRTPLGEELKKKTQNYYLIALRALLKYLAASDVKSLPPEKIELAREEDREVSFLTPEELERLFGAPLTNTAAGVRDRTIIEVLFSTGLRVSELVALDRTDINLTRREFGVRGKGRKLRLVFLSDRAVFWLTKYLEMRSDADPALFIRHHGAAPSKSEDLRLTSRSVQRILGTLTRKAGIVKIVTPHTMRHSFATDLLRNGADIRSVQALLGHASVTTTQIYTHVTNQQLREVHRKYHGRNPKM